MNESLAERVTRYRAVESWLAHQLGRIREDLARLEVEEGALRARRPALPPPDWVIETIRTGRGPQPFRVHRGDCSQGKGQARQPRRSASAPSWRDGVLSVLRAGRRAPRWTAPPETP
ncbi:hypothetical protein GCM10020254_82440 [Streptomyces goshikiensis]